eukprot:CAMPEP_0172534552 /NCGR_PEP_ID=MMETSP1067-20121228/6870_1 /TAXON_ID=265564 ORGANISM="Thalassiosira punctigera, Strain Tpunct2005C2" /NCGR_SAMPLE_ID=MMETSP1067 /ASSEMBLY_ACC=CAM_ASM_000444 /LENGTH=513 /DNA_ID=CAMNT_0013319359 /DNA_START=47 /DNA_END=1588 /DNA_ORIENTATION=+
MMNIPFHLVSKKSIFRADGTVRGGFHVAVVLLPLLLGTSHAGPLHRKKIRGGGKDDGGVVSDLIADNMQTTSPSPTFQCPDKTAIKIEVKTDEYPWETSWSVANKCNGDVEKSVPFYTYDEELFLYSTRWCLSETEAIWNFTIEDIGSGGEGDGLCCRYGDGYYNITVGGEVVGSGAEFTRSASHVFGSGCPPTVSPRPSFSPTETTAPTEDLCPDATAIELILKTDNYPGEISWTLVDDCTGEEEGALPSPEFPEYNQYLTVYTHKWCLPESVWTWTIEDTGASGAGDGICCGYGDGYYILKREGEVVGSGGNYTRTDSHTFGLGCAPSSSPRPSDSPTKSPAPTEDPCPGKNTVKVDVKTDYYPDETSWSLIDECTGLLLESMPSVKIPQYDTDVTEYNHRFCLDDTQWTFTIEDSQDDGICCDYGEGSYSVQVNGQAAASGGAFQDSESTTFGFACAPSFSPAPSAAPTKAGKSSKSAKSGKMAGNVAYSSMSFSMPMDFDIDITQDEPL